MSSLFHEKFDGKKVYFIADPHWQHRNLVKGESSWTDKTGCRDFSSLDEMNRIIIKSYQDILPDDAILFILGDTLFGNKKNLKFWLDQIPCSQIHLIYGNHDDFIREDLAFQNLFTSCQNYLEIFCRGKTGHYTMCCLFHYPIKSWRDKNKGSFALSGHVHGTGNNDGERQLDMDWNIWRRPVNFLEIEQILTAIPFRKLEN